MTKVEALHRALTAMPPRSAEVVCQLALEGLTVETLAEWYGLRPEAAAILVWRAARDFEAALRGTTAAPLPDALEAKYAPALSDPTRTDDVLSPVRAALAALTAQRQPVEARRQAARVAAEQAYARPRAIWLRRLFFACVVALIAFFTWRQAQRPPPAPRPVLPK